MVSEEDVISPESMRSQGPKLLIQTASEVCTVRDRLAACCANEGVVEE